MAVVVTRMGTGPNQCRGPYLSEEFQQMLWDMRPTAEEWERLQRLWGWTAHPPPSPVVG